MDFNDFCQSENIIIHSDWQLSHRVKGFCYCDGEHYYIFINPIYSSDQNQQTLAHELVHVLKNHFLHFTEDHDACECEAHILARKIRIIWAS